MEGSPVEDAGGPESWEVADVEESMKRLMLSHTKDSATSSSSGNISASELCPIDLASNSASCAASGAEKAGCVGLSEDAISEVDQFLREALQNPRERLSILRMEQDVLKFIQDPVRQQLEFQQLPTSYLRLAAHRVAQHYFLQSMVLLDNSLPDGSGSRIVVRKTSTNCRLPSIRLADIPVTLPQDDSDVIKVAIKRRPQKHSPVVGSSNANSVNENHLKSVEERKEEYNRARARIFNSGNHSSPPAAKPEIQSKKADKLKVGSAGMLKVDEKSVSESAGLSSGRGLVDSSTGSSRSAASARSREKDPISRYRPSNRVAIFRDRDVDCKDPDYDRSYDRKQEDERGGSMFAFELILTDSGMCKDLILDLDLMLGLTLSSQCTPLLSITIQSFLSLDQLIGLRFLLNPHDLYLGHGLHHQALPVWVMVIKRLWLHHLVQIMLMQVLLLLYIYTPPNTLVNVLECRSFILMNITKHICRLNNRNMMLHLD